MPAYRTVRLGIDVDGVLANFTGSMVTLLKQLGDTTPLPVDDPGFPAAWYWNKHYGVPDAIWAKAWDVINEDPTFWVSLRNMPNTLMDLRKLFNVFENGHEIYYITTRPGNRPKFQTEAWLAARQVLCPTVLIAGDPAAKGKIADGLKLDAMIDDRPENLMALPKATMPFIYKAPYNLEWRTACSRLAFAVGSVSEMIDTLDNAGVAQKEAA